MHIYTHISMLYTYMYVYDFFKEINRSDCGEWQILLNLQDKLASKKFS